MRTLYTILFFVGTVLLACLSFLFLHRLDQGGPIGVLIVLFIGIVASILMLVFLLKKYINNN